MGSSVLFAYPEIGTLAGLLGVFMYAFASIIPLFIFVWLGPIMRSKCPHGFTLTEFVKERFGRINQIYISLMSMAYMFCYMISELSSIGIVLNILGGIDQLPPTIVLCVVTTLYAAYGGLRASLFTDNVQGICIFVLVLIAAIAFSTNVNIDKSNIEESGLLKSSKLGWELLYILSVAISSANLFHQGFWQRVFASKNDRELQKSAVFGSFLLFPTLFLIGFTGIIAVWGGLCCNDPAEASSAFFTLLATLPDWVVGFVILLVVSLSCSAYDTLLSAMVSTLSNDLFANKLPLNYIRLFTLLFNVPAVVLGLRNLDVLRVFLIGDLVAATSMPPILLGLIDDLYFLNGLDALIGGIGGLLSIFIFGTIYLGNAYDGINLIQLPQGLYAEDYSVLGAFIVAPLGGVFFTFSSLGIRLGWMYLNGRLGGTPFKFPERPAEIDTRRYAGEEFLAETNVTDKIPLAYLWENKGSSETQ